MREGSGPFAPPKRLARHASFAWDTQRPGTPGSPSIGFFSNRSQVSLFPLGSLWLLHASQPCQIQS